jgi:zinc transport system ATP-binding protein
MIHAIIQLEDVSFAYGTVPVLRNVNIQIYPKEFVGLIGPNGGGKTTLLKLILGFLTPSSGRIKVLGKNPQEFQQTLAYVPQNLRFDKEFPISVLELVLLGRLSHLPWYGRYSKEDKALAHDVLEQVGLIDYRHHAFGNLSGGQIQRALIARALVSNPQILLLDEPTANVDAHAEAEIYQFLKGLSDKMTILMVTHDLKAAINTVKRVICVQGSAVSLKPEDVCEHFAFGLYHTPLINPQRSQ